MGQLDLLEAGPAEDGSEQAEQVRLFMTGEHDIMQKVFAGQEEEERGTQVEIEVRAKKLKAIVHRQSCRGDLGILVGLTDANVWESIGKLACSHVFYCKLHEDLYQVLQVTRAACV